MTEQPAASTLNANNSGKTCFVAMPVATDPTWLPMYAADDKHFIHVLRHLFAPALEKAGFEVIEPIMTGGEVIQGQIIRHLEEADLVLVDMSRHNANVFFELGIRTALNLPVAVVKDGLTDRIPFDMGIVNTYTYDPTLAPWTIEAQIDAIATHALNSYEKSQGKNAMWDYFGVTRTARAATAPENSTEAKLDFLVREVDVLRSRLPDPGANIDIQSFRRERERRREKVALNLKGDESRSIWYEDLPKELAILMRRAESMAAEGGFSIKPIRLDPMERVVALEVTGPARKSQLLELTEFFVDAQYAISIA